MSRQDLLQPSHLDIHSVKSPESQNALAVFLNLLSTCAGPAGKIHTIRSSCGGHVTFTSDCARLLNVLSISRPELKFIVAAVQAHLKQHGDCGLFMGHSCVCLIKSTFDTGINFHVQSSLFDLFMKMMQNYLNESDCPVCIKADMTDLQVLLAYVKSILRSKHLLYLTRFDSDKLSELVVRTFVESIPTQQSTKFKCCSDRVFVICLENRPVRSSKLKHGLFLEYCEVSVRDGEIELDINRMSRSSCAGENNDGDRAGWVKVALFTCSLSGDMEEVIDATVEVTQEQSSEAEELAINKMLVLCEDLEFHQVSLILCQKVIHPEVKAQLKTKGILFIDRLGSRVIPYVQDLTGARRICSILRKDELRHMIGYVDSVQHVIEGSKGFLHLNTSQSSIITLFLYAQWEERLAELKGCMMTALKGLQTLVNEPKLLAGGGCWQIHSSFMLQKLVQKKLSTIAEEAGCANTQVLSSLATFCSSLHQWVISLTDSLSDIVVDRTSFHCWNAPKGNGRLSMAGDHSVFPCRCGLKSVPGVHLENFHFLMEADSLLATLPQANSTAQAVATDIPVHPATVLDSFTAATQGLSRGIFTANQILSVGQFITDRN